jgi:hypothetical protein
VPEEVRDFDDGPKRGANAKRVEDADPAEQRPEPSEPSDAVKAWVAKHVEAIDRAPDLDKLDAFVGNRALRLAQLPEDLQQLCAGAYDARRIALAATQEPEPDDKPLWQATVEQALAGARDATTLAGIKAVEKEWLRHCAGIPDESAANAVDAAIDAARREIMAQIAP